MAVYRWLPLISHYFPGITPFNVYGMTLDWWRIYMAEAKAIEAANAKK